MATRNSGRTDDRNSNRSASSANPASSAGRASGTSGGSRQNSGGISSESARRTGSSGGLDTSATHTTAGTNAGIGNSSANTSNVGAASEARTGAPSANQGSTSRTDQERQLHTSREAGAAHSSPTNIGQPQQQSRGFGAPSYYGPASPFAMMRRMMDDMDRLFSDFGFVQPGLLASSFFDPDVWGAGEPSRALASGQPRGQHGAGQTRSQSDLQRGGKQAGLQPWSQGLWSPQVEVRERDNNIVVRADLPGLSRDDVDVEVDNDALVIRGERRNDWEDEREGNYRSERSYGTFYRAIALPEGVDPNTCKATFKDGVLEVTLPKPQRSQSRGRKIDIK